MAELIGKVIAAASRASVGAVFASGSIPTEAQIRFGYYRGALMIVAAVVLGAAAVYVASFNPVLGAALGGAAVALARSGGYAIIAALQDDRQYYGGRVFESLDPFTREAIRFVFGAP